MLFYIILLCIIALLAFSPKVYKKDAIFIIFLILTFVGAFRNSNVGLDIGVYTLNINAMKDSVSTWNKYTEFEPGFNYLLWFLKKYISESPLIILSICFVVYITLLFYFIVKISNTNVKFDVRIALLIYLLSTYYTYSFNIIRQTFGFSLSCLFLYVFLIKRRNLFMYSITIVLVSILVHKTLIVMLLIIPIWLVKKHLSRTIMVLILIISFLIFYKQQFSLLFLAEWVEDVKYYSYLTEISEEKVSVLSNLIHTIIAIWIIYISPQKNNEFLLIYWMGVILLNLLGSINPLFIRVANIYLFFEIFHFAYLWNYFKNTKYNLTYRVVLLSYLLLFYVNTLCNNYGKIIPYENVLFNIN